MFLRIGGERQRRSPRTWAFKGSVQGKRKPGRGVQDTLQTSLQVKVQEEKSVNDLEDQKLPSLGDVKREQNGGEEKGGKKTSFVGWANQN